MEIRWMQEEPYRWIGVVGNYNYELQVEQPNWPLKGFWHWKIFRDEDKIIDGDYEDNDPALTADEAKTSAEQVLQAYINEQDSFTNCLKEVMK